MKKPINNKNNIIIMINTKKAFKQNPFSWDPNTSHYSVICEQFRSMNPFSYWDYDESIGDLAELGFDKYNIEIGIGTRLECAGAREQAIAIGIRDAALLNLITPLQMSEFACQVTSWIGDHGL